MSPELIDPERFDLKKTRITKESDCYALGMVIYEVLSGQTPFSPHNAPLVIKMVLDGQRPRRPEGKGGKCFTDGIWEVLEHCWKHQPKERTSTEAVLQYLEGIPPLPRPDVGGITETDTGKQANTTASNSRVFSLFRLGLELTLNHRCGITGPTVARSDNGLPVTPHKQLPGGIDLTDSGELPASPQQGNSEGFVSWIIRVTLGKFIDVT